MDIKNIVFDFGGVLVDWNPRYLYKDQFQNQHEMEFFLNHICTDEWNLEQDKGRSLAEGTIQLQNEYPAYHSLIQLFYDQWEVMLKGEISETVSVLHNLKKNFKIFGLTNWSAETIAIAYNRFSFFKEFDGIVVSGQEKMIKPDKKIYQLLLDRYRIKAEDTIFIDDNIKNIHAAAEMGFNVIHFNNAVQLAAELSAILAT